MIRCDVCPVDSALPCPDAPAHCPAILAGNSGRAAQLVTIAERRANPDYPGLFTQAASLVKATVAHVADGMRHATQATQADRAAICSACPNYVPGDDRCAICGCGLPIKRLWASSVCPDDPPRWVAEPEA